MSTYAKANRTAQWFSNAYSSATINPNCVVWHSTETFGWPSYSGGSMAPNYTVLPDIANKRVLWRAHFEDEESSRALVNAPGGVETNTANDVQVEIIGTCNPAWAKTWPGTSKVAGRDYIYLPDAPDWFLAGLADFSVDMNRRHGVPLTSGVTWAAYPGSYGVNASQRMSFSQWRAFVGHCGHQHVPENDHGDPGALPMGRILTLAKSGTATPAPIPVAPQEEDIMASLDDVKNTIHAELAAANLLTKADGATLRNDLKWQNQQAAKLAGQIAGLSSALTALAAGKPVDLDAVTAAAKAGAQAALDEKIAGADVSLNVTP